MLENRTNTRITVLRGGPSSERDVSLVSGAAVADACRRLGYVVWESDVTPDNLAALDRECDLVFPVLHGPFGEDGQLQSLLEKRSLRYVGSDSHASRLAMDKAMSKHAWRQAGLPTAPWQAVTSVEEFSSSHRDAANAEVVVKPACEGSSIGVFLCDTHDKLQQVVSELVPKFGKVIIEKRLIGPELTVGILGDTPLPVVQIKPAAGFYDYEAKYNRDDTEYLLQPTIDTATYAEVQRIALKAFQVLRCRDYGRIDLIVDEILGPQLLEINTIPGFTSHSILPKAAQHAGIEFDQLVETLVEMGLQRMANEAT